MFKTHKILYLFGLFLITLLTFQVLYPLQEGFKSSRVKNKSSPTTKTTAANAGLFGGFFSTQSGLLAEKTGDAITDATGNAVGSAVDSAVANVDSLSTILIGIVILFAILLMAYLYFYWK